MSSAQSADATQIHYEDSGIDGVPVVLVHGITESLESLRPVVEQLDSAGYRTIALDLRGHGRSGHGERYDVAAMVDDVVAVTTAAGVERPHLVGHSLGGVVVSAVGARLPVTSVVNVDQALRLASFKDMLTPVEPMLRDPATFAAVMQGVFEQLAGPLLTEGQRARLALLRRPEQSVVLGVWDLIFTEPVEVIDATIDQLLAGYRRSPVPYLSLFGADPGDDYADWLTDRIPGAVTETWPQHGHYPHLVDVERFVDRLETFWSQPADQSKEGLL